MITSATTFLEDPALMEPFTHVANLPSKNVRGHFIDAIAKNLLRLPDNSVKKLQEATAILHSASLLFDDIEDGTLMRRGEPAAHVIFGMPLSLNSASAATCAALEVILKDEDDDDNKDDENDHDDQSSSPTRGTQVSTNRDDEDGEVISSNRQDCFISRRQESQIVNNLAVSSSFCERQLFLQTSKHANKNDDKFEQEGDENRNEMKKFQEDSLSELRRAALQGRLTRVYIDNMKLLHSGQGKDIYWRDIHQCPTLAEYRLMARQKTGGLFRLVAMWALELERHFLLEAAFEEDNEQKKRSNTTSRNTLLLSLCDDFGLCFQILDDVANLCDETLHAMKTFADDLDEGKFSYPAIHCILAGEQKSLQKDKRLLHALCRTNVSLDAHAHAHHHKNTNNSQLPSAQMQNQSQPITTKKSVAEKEFCLHLMKESGSIKASCDEVLNLCESLREKTHQIAGIVNSNLQGENDEEMIINCEKFRTILLGLIVKMADRAQKFSLF